MPVIEVHLLEGYAAQERQRLGEALTDATRLVVPAPADAITVMFHEMHASSYYRGRTTRTPAPALPDPSAQVHQFLDCLSRRDLDAARRFLADGYSLHFPGADAMYSLDELIQWSSSRYRTITKTFDNTECFGDAQGRTVVYCTGSLSGEWPDGSTFTGIRFIDRFELSAGKITRQEVWNDLAESRLKNEKP